MTRARRKPRSFPGNFALTLGISGQGALALALEGVWRKTAREDAAALGGVSRDPAFYCAPLGSGARDAGVQHTLVLISRLWTV